MTVEYFLNIKDLPNNPLLAVKSICDAFDSMINSHFKNEQGVYEIYEVSAQLKDIFLDFYHVLKNLQEKYELIYVPIRLYTIDSNDINCYEFIRRTFLKTREQIAEPLNKHQEVKKFLDSKNRIANTMGFQEENRRVETIKRYLDEEVKNNSFSSLVSPSLYLPVSQSLLPNISLNYPGS